MAEETVDESHHNGTDAGTYEPDQYIYNPGDTPPHVHVRGVPAEGFFFENNRCALEDPLDALEQSSTVGSTNQYGFKRLFFDNNSWGVDFS